MKRLLDFFEFSAKTGLYLPGAYDARVDGPSVSLLFAHIANIQSIVGIIMLMINELKTGVMCAMAYSVLMLIFYLMRSINKVEVDVDDGQLKLEGNNSNVEK